MKKLTINQLIALCFAAAIAGSVAGWFFGNLIIK
jgi:hypothetical protein